MINKTNLMFLESQVDFYFIDDFPRNKFIEDDLTIFEKKAIQKSIAFIWADTLTDDLINKMGNIDYDKVIIVMSDRYYNLRRAEVLLGTKVERIYLYNKKEFNFYDIHEMCTFSNNSQEIKKNENEGIKRVLNFNSLDEKGNDISDKIFFCIYDNKCLVEFTNNLNIACLQLKGKRASAIYVEETHNDVFSKILTILPKDNNKQILLNNNSLTEENENFLKANGIEFQKIDIAKEGTLVQSFDKIKLPLLNDIVWEKSSVVINKTLRELLGHSKIKNKYFAVSADISKKSEKDLEIRYEVVLRGGYQINRESKLIFYKRQIVEKEFIIINNKEISIQQDILRMLLAAGNKKYVLLALGKNKDYEHLTDLYNEMMKKSFYKSRELLYKVLSPKELVKFLETFVKEEPVVIEEVKNEVEIQVKKDNTDNKKNELMKLDKDFRVAFSQIIGKIIDDFMELSKNVVVSSNDSDILIVNNIMHEYNGSKNIKDIFKNKEEKKKFHKFLKSITPDSSKTEFPENTKDLVLIIKALIYKILKDYCKDSGDVNFIKKKINNINLEIDPFEKLVTELKNLMNIITDMIKEENDNIFISNLTALLKKYSEIESKLVQLILQFNFVLLAVPHELTSEKFFTIAEICNSESRIKMVPFKELSLLKEEMHLLINDHN